MPHPYLLFCPYLPMTNSVQFADWELGPLQSFEDQWADSRFKDRATTFLRHFVGPDGKPIENPALLCRKGKQLDGQRPSRNEVAALELALAFSFVDRNPRWLPENEYQWGTVTADNAELHAWPIDLEKNFVTKSTGYLVMMNTIGYRIGDPRLVMSPPLDLPGLSMGCPTPDPLVLEGIYKTTLASYRSPDTPHATDRVRIATEWFVRAWHNNVTVRYPERIVFLKTAFEAITGTSKTHKSAKELRGIFEELPGTTVENSEYLVWSPEEEPVHTQTWVDRNGETHTCRITDLEHWFRAFGKARNTIIHEGVVPELMYSGSNPNYDGHFFFTAEFLLRVIIKILLSKLGYENAWRPEYWRTIHAILEEEDGTVDP